MLKRRSFPYIVIVCTVVFLSISYISYRAYQNHVKFKAFMLNAQTFNRSVEHDQGHEHIHILGEHMHDKKNTHSPVAVRSSSGLSFFGGKQGEEYVYEINGFPVYSSTSLSQEQIELREWIQTGKMTPAVEEQFRIREQLLTYVVQRVVTPDGKLRQVIVPHDSQYEEGDAILRSELIPLSRREAAKDRDYFSLEGAKLIIDGAEYPYPDEYHTIADPYERFEYANKFDASINLGISMTEVEKKIAAGELDVSLSETDKRLVDEQEAIAKRFQMLSPESPPLSGEPPVKVSFLSNEGENALPGWMRKGESKHLSRSGEAASGGPYSETYSASEDSIPDDAKIAPVRADFPISSSDLPGMVKSSSNATKSFEFEKSNLPPNVADLEKRLTPVGIEAKLSKGLSPERFDKEQQLINQYGSEEGLLPKGKTK